MARPDQLLLVALVYAVGSLLLPVYGYAAQTGGAPAWVGVAFLPFAVVVFLNLLDTTWPDRAADAAVGKRTLATRWSADRLRRLYWVGVAVYAASVVLAAGDVPLVVSVVSVAVLPALGVAGRRYTRRRSPAPTVAAMVALAVAQTAAWLLAA